MDHLDKFDRIELYEDLYPNPSSSLAGSMCSERSDEKKLKFNQTYGEIRREGLNDLIEMIERRDLTNVKSLTDLGCGIGKLLVATMLFHPQVKEMHGIEMSRPRFELASQVIRRLYDYLIEHFPKGKKKEIRYQLIATSDEITLLINDRRLVLSWGNLYDKVLYDSDLYVADFCFAGSCREGYKSQARECFNLMRKCKRGSVFLFYEDLASWLDASALSRCFEKLEPYPLETTWRTITPYRFSMFQRRAPPSKSSPSRFYRSPSTFYDSPRKSYRRRRNQRAPDSSSYNALRR